MRIRKHQTVCEWINVKSDKPKDDSLIGLAIETLGKGDIINGLRHPSEGKTNGWYIWAGEYSSKDKFFTPVCYKHISNYIDNSILEYLDLPHGYRFLIDNYDYEDVWFDEKLLNI